MAGARATSCDFRYDRWRGWVLSTWKRITVKNVANWFVSGILFSCDAFSLRTLIFLTVEKVVHELFRLLTETEIYRDDSFISLRGNNNKFYIRKRGRRISRSFINEFSRRKRNLQFQNRSTIKRDRHDRSIIHTFLMLYPSIDRSLPLKVSVKRRKSIPRRIKRTLAFRTNPFRSLPSLKRSRSSTRSFLFPDLEAISVSKCVFSPVTMISRKRRRGDKEARFANKKVEKDKRIVDADTEGRRDAENRRAMLLQAM